MAIEPALPRWASLAARFVSSECAGPSRPCWHSRAARLSHRSWGVTVPRLQHFPALMAVRGGGLLADDLGACHRPLRIRHTRTAGRATHASSPASFASGVRLCLIGGYRGQLAAIARFDSTLGRHCSTEIASLHAMEQAEWPKPDPPASPPRRKRRR